MLSERKILLNREIVCYTFVMGNATYRNQVELEQQNNIDELNLTDMIDGTLPDALDDLIISRDIPSSKISAITGISKSYINDLRNRSRHDLKPSREKLISICVAVGADVDETNRILKLAKYRELYSRDEADSLIIWGLLRKKSYDEIYAILSDHGFDSRENMRNL